MTVMAALFGLVPIMFGAATGGDTMRRLAAPMIGGLVTTYVMTLLVYPVIFYYHKRREVLHRMRSEGQPDNNALNRNETSQNQG